MLEPDWLIGQYKREAGIVNEAGTFALVAEQKLSRTTPNVPTRLQCFQLVVGEHEIFTFELRYSHRKAD